MFYYTINEVTKLEILQEKHGDALFALTESGREYLSEWMPWAPDIKGAEDTKAFIRSTLKAFGNQGSLSCAIIYKEEVAGVIGFHEIDYRNKKTSMGYWLGEGFQGKGIMTEASRAFVQYAFNEIGLNRLEIRAGVENKKSRAVPERLGFMYEGTQRQVEVVNGRFIDHALYAILKEDWKG
ncbi:GNAT family N-acetyltransferase [Alteribacter keqinensis]|uniref:N-acetyltransferase n=1 Tax=Alteribacter keqinensis TaxID=2483800 RepID=A0A3M7TSZ5_9BACI|nr:GNAT family protein [Alteribacter keqinensis]RNA68637.1 N-acetyltransferase [Alteribacter keqinensis]